MPATLSERGIIRRTHVDQRAIGNLSASNEELFPVSFMASSLFYSKWSILYISWFNSGSKQSDHLS